MASRRSDLLARLRTGALVLDGAMGTMLFEAGLEDGVCPELWNATRPDAVREIHRAYLEAGADIVETNTFGGTRLKLAAHGLGDRARELNRLGVEIARSVCPPGKYVAGSIGPTGQIPDSVEGIGSVPLEEFRAAFAEQASALAEAGADLLAIETMMLPEEALIAIRAAREATDLPVMCTMFFKHIAARGIDRTLWGSSPAEAARFLTDAGADIVGSNCGEGGPARAAIIIREMRAATPLPLAAYPNAGLPRLVDGRTVYDMPPDEMAAGYPAILEAGASIVGACCGSTPAHIRQIAAAVREWCVTRSEHRGGRPC